MHILFLLGLSILLGFAGGRLFERLRIPQVVGFIVVGSILGDSLLGLLKGNLLASFTPIISLALGFIGFMVGGELKVSVFRRHGSQFITILLFQGIMPMLVVGLLVTLITGKAYLGILLGTIASATAPAATTNVLWEYRARGLLTTTVLAIVALDDGLALILYGFAIAFAQILVGGEAFSPHMIVFEPMREIFGSLLLGGVIGWGSQHILRLLKRTDDILALMVGFILLTCGAAMSFGLSLILSNMALGFVLANFLPERSQRKFDIIRGFTPPIYILFFVFAGARLQLGLLPKIGLIGLTYIVGRSLGKVLGARLGSTISHAPQKVVKYLGWALFAQAGIAVGLAIDAYERLALFGPSGVEAGGLIIDVITATIFIFEFIGPPLVKYAITRAGEIPKPHRRGISR